MIEGLHGNEANFCILRAIKNRSRGRPGNEAQLMGSKFNCEVTEQHVRERPQETVRSEVQEDPVEGSTV